MRHLLLCAALSALSSSIGAQPESVDRQVDGLIATMVAEEASCRTVRVRSASTFPAHPLDAAHGVARAGAATVFPQAIGMAATLDTALMHEVATRDRDEARAKHTSARGADQRGRYQGLTFWSPNINIFRDPRWGRGQETYGEDPYLTGAHGRRVRPGLQGDDPRYLKAIATAEALRRAQRPGAGAPRLRRARRREQRPRGDLSARVPARGRRRARSRRSCAPTTASTASRPARANACCKDILRGDWGFDGLRRLRLRRRSTTSTTGAQDHAPNAEAAPRAARRRGSDLECGSRTNISTFAQGGRARAARRGGRRRGAQAR